MSNELVPNPMRGQLVAPAQKQSVPAGMYDAVFINVEYRPIKEADPMTGKGGQQWASYRFVWKVVGGLCDGQTAYRETSVSNSTKSRYAETIAWLTGKVAEDYDLDAYVNKRYRIVVSQKLNKTGQPSNYTQVFACISV